MSSDLDRTFGTKGFFGWADLNPCLNYDIVCGESGRWLTRGIQGGDAIRAECWVVGDEAWPAGEETFDGDPVAIASEDAR